MTDTDPRAAAVEAAHAFVRRTRGWIGAQVSEAEPANTGRSQNYAQIIQYNVPKFCGRAVADATYAVTLYNPSITLDNSSFTVLAVGHFVDGWRVWGFYR